MLLKKQLKDFNLNPNSTLQHFFNLGIMSEGVLLAGGSLITLYDPKHIVKDFDLFLKDLYSEYKVVKKLLDLGFKETFCLDGDLVNYEKECHIDQSVSYKMRVQVVTRQTYLDAEDLISTFDLTPCCIATDGETVWYDHRAPYDIKDKLLRINSVTWPVDVLLRILKYRDKGYSVQLVYDEFMEMVEGKTFPDHRLRNYLDDPDINEIVGLDLNTVEPF